jgi:hypothetical protein
LKKLPSPSWGRGCPEPTFSSAGAGRVRGPVGRGQEQLSLPWAISHGAYIPTKTVGTYAPPRESASTAVILPPQSSALLHRSL